MISTTATYDNSNYTEDMEAESGFSTPLLTFAAIMTILIMIVGIVGNFLTVAALINCPKVRNVAAAFIMSLCIADLLFCALVLPFSAYRFIQGTWTPREFLCKMIPFIQYGNIGVSLLCIAMITINRYVMIAHHSSYGKIYKRHWIAAMIIFCWVFSYGMQLPTLVGAWGTFDYDPKLGTCSIMNDDHGRSSKTALFVTAFVIPCIIIIACYAKIFWVVHKSEQRMKRHAKKQNSIPNNLRVITSSNVELGNGQSRVSSADSSSFSTDVKQEAVQKQTPSRVKDQREVRAKRNEWRITKMVLAIFLSFVICYLPITIAKVADQDVNQPTLHIFSYIMLYLSACLNPIIYVIMNKQYRKAYKTVLMCDVGRFLGCTKKGKVDGKGGPADSSVAEKWKDTELSHNHSRTLVSQMSANDQLNTSFSAVTPVMMAAPSVTLELVAKVNASSFNGTMAAGKKPPPTPIRRPPLAVIDTNLEAIIKEPKIVENNKQQSQENIPSQNNNNNNNNSCPISQPPLIIRSKTGSKEPNRIALVGGDIILEEEEEEEDNNEKASQVHIIKTTRQMPLRRIDLEPVVEMLETPVTPPPPPPPVVQRMIVRPTPVYVNASVLHQKKNLFYGQNINDTPDNENVKPKLQDKPKL